MTNRFRLVIPAAALLAGVGLFVLDRDNPRFSTARLILVVAVGLVTVAAGLDARANGEHRIGDLVVLGGAAWLDGFVWVTGAVLALNVIVLIAAAEGLFSYKDAYGLWLEIVAGLVPVTLAASLFATRLAEDRLVAIVADLETAGPGGHVTERSPSSTGRPGTRHRVPASRERRLDQRAGSSDGDTCGRRRPSVHAD